MSFSESNGRYGQQVTRVKKYLSSEMSVDDIAVEDSGTAIESLLSKINEEGGLLKRRVHHLNSLAKVIRKTSSKSLDFKCKIWDIIEELRYSLSFDAKEVRAGVLRVLRYMLTSSEVFEIMCKLHVDFLVARSVDTAVVRDIERLQALRFIQQVVMVCPRKLTASLVSPLVAIATSDSEPSDTMTWSALATLAEIVIILPRFACQCGVISALQRGVLKCQIPRISESIVLCLSYLYNHPNSRQYMRPHLDIQSLLAPLTDLHYRFLVDNIESSYTKSFRERRVESSKMAVTALFKTWPGIISLCAYDMSGISSFVEMLPLVESFAQREMLLVLYEIFQFQVPVWTEDYREAEASIDPSQYRDEWSLDNGWVAEEGKTLLPPKAMERTNLLDCYNAFVLACFLESDLISSLVQVVKVCDSHISVMATILIGELLHLANSLLPAEYLGDSLSLPDLIASAMTFDCQAKRNRASEVINCLNQVHQLKKDTVKPSSLYLKLSLEQTGYFSGKGSVDAQLMKNVFVSTEMDEVTLQSHIRDTQVLAVKEFTAWNWNLIFSLLQHPYISTVSMAEDSMFGRFIRTLTNFFKPDNRQFSSIIFSYKNSQKYSSVGLQLVKYLGKMNSSEDSLLLSLINSIVSQLGQVTASKLTSDVFSPSSISNKLTRDYFLMLGAVSFHNSTIFKQSKAYGPLLDICSITSRRDLHKLIIASLDFAHDVQSRVILEKLLTSGDEVTRLYATRHMRIFLRLNAPLFISWGMEMLIGQLYDLSSEVAEEAIDILDEACEEESFLDVLVLQQPALLHLSEKGVALFTRFVSVKRGYTMLSDIGHLKEELTAWIKDFNFRYVSVAEQRLAESLTSYRYMQEGVYHRRSDISVTVHKAFVPVHFYGQLVKQEEGCYLLRSEKHIEKLTLFLRQEPLSAEEILQTKAAIWAVGHIGTSVGGLSILMDYGLIHDLVLMAQTSPILSIRGTCYYAICLLSKTARGAELLLSLGWTSVRHSKDEKWPIRFEEIVEELVTTPSSPVSPTSSVKSLSSIDGIESVTDSSPLKSSSLTSVETSIPKSPLAFTKSTSIASSYPVKKGGSLYLKNYHLRPTRPTSFTSNNEQQQSPTINTTSSLDSPTEVPLTGSLRQRRVPSGRQGSTSVRSASGYLGVALPLQLQSLFMMEDINEDLLNSRAYSVSTEIFDKDHNFILDGLTTDTSSQKTTPTEDHSDIDTLSPTTEDQPSKKSSSPLLRQRRLESSSDSLKTHEQLTSSSSHKNEGEDDVSEMIKPHKASIVSRTSMSSTTSGSVSFDEHSPDGRKLLHRECLELIYSLSSDVSQKKNAMLLNILFEKFPSLQEDVSLYWKAMLILSTYPYKLNCRRFIQSKFVDLTFEKLTKPASVKKETLSPEMRRRSSTSDMKNLEKNNQQISSDNDPDSVSILTDEMDTMSVSSGEVLEEDDDIDSMATPVNTTTQQQQLVKDSDHQVKMRNNSTVFIADRGNRLSQLDLSDGNPSQKQIESIVEIAYDL